MRITTWNVNGLRTVAPLPGRFATDLATSDIVCVQETRVTADDADLEPLAFVPGYVSLFGVCTARRGYSGVATFCRAATAVPLAASTRLDDATGGAAIAPHGPCPAAPCDCGGAGYSADTLSTLHDEGRVVVTDHGRFVLLNVYVPAVSDAARLPFKLGFLHALRSKVDALRHVGRSVIVVGDFNICPARIDSAEQMAVSLPDPKWPFRPARRWLTSLLDRDDGRCVDVFRHMHPTRRAAYTCWSEATRSRQTNFGVRIDLVVAHAELLDSVVDIDVWQHVTGSDHCPVSVSLRDPDVPAPVPRVPPRACTQFWPRFAKRQRSVSDFLTRRTGSAAEQSRGGGAFGTASLKLRATGQTTGSVSSQKRLRPESAADIDAAGTSSQEVERRQALKRRRLTKTTARQTSLKSFFAIRNPAVNSTEAEYKLDTREKGETTDGNAAKQSTTDFDPAKREATRQAWRKILSGPPPPPRCRHGLPAVSKTVGKSGENRGRKFFACQYPRGTGAESNCEFFQWASKR